MTKMDRRKFLQMVGLGSAVALLPPVVRGDPGSAYSNVVTLGEFDDDPFSVDITVQFNGNLANDEDGFYALFYQDGEDLILVQDGKIYGRDKVVVPCPVQQVKEKKVVVRAIGMKTAQFVEAQQSPEDSQTIHVIAPLERNYVNPSS